MASAQVKLQVVGDVDWGACMFVVGNCSQLGDWRAQGAVPLDKLPQPHENADGDLQWIWETTVELAKNTDVSFRYFQGKVIPHGGESGSVSVIEVLLWETNIQPRVIHVPDQDEFESPLAIFGFYDGSHTTSYGWLENDACMQVRFHSNPLFMWKIKHREQLYSIKCSPLDFETNTDVRDHPHLEESNSMDGPPVCDRTAMMYYNLSDASPKPRIQPPTGCPYNKDDYLVFLARGYNQTHLGFQVDIYVHSRDSELEARFVGTAHLLPSLEKSSLYSKRVPIIGLNHRPIGEVQVETLRITPMAGYDWKMDVSYQNHWKWRQSDQPLNVGHRGMGSSYKRVSNVRENTVKSLYSAGREGADFVEFDVLLSKDNVPVIYHDFSVCLSTVRRSSKEKHMLEVPVKDLNLHNLQSLRLFHSSSNSSSRIEVSEEAGMDDDNQPFPTLESCFKLVDSHVGFDIEVKYPQQLATGESEMDNYFDLNMYIDRILDVVFAFAGDRKVIFTTFHADACVMLNLKQNKYPVLLLSNGPSKRYTPYSDWRCKSFMNGIKFAKAEGLLGVNFQADGLMLDLSIIPFIRSLNLILFVWGEDLNEKSVRDTLKAHSVDAVIFDRGEHPGAFEVQGNLSSRNSMNELIIQSEATRTLHDVLENLPQVDSSSTSCSSV